MTSTSVVGALLPAQGCASGPAADHTPPAAFHVVAKHSGLVLAVREARTDDGADAIQWTDSGGDEQLWRFVLSPRPR